MYGQTNCWVHPELPYVAFVTTIGQGEVFVCTRRSARNMAYQGFTEDEGKLSVLLELTGQVICFLYHNELQDGTDIQLFFSMSHFEIAF
jgi:hypothetical protein